ncbi:hypothetical protein BV25DRAFT_1829438 [Artomyces pyxidatus]|uniref:Uncharacterized protein n=1 Tax=Artomyces pyxidatus TaxID=48021 RepID=A0ACB8SRJ5_9AGAM|nr:hypothetical protein BV25DRAFT_1829438 [Artomyces pyxidatus]
MAVTQVCNRWRRVAYRATELWTTISLENKEWASVSLQQSKPSPLSIHWPMEDREPDEQPDIEALRLVLEELPRIQELVLTAQPRELYKDASYIDITNQLLARCPAPNLKTLHLGTSPPPLFLHDIFCGEAPSSLHTLTLGTCQLRPSSCLFHNGLRELELDICEVWDSYEDLQETLARMPQLETLHILAFTLPEAHDSLAPAGPAVHLPKLEKLALVGDTFQIAKALRAFTFPNNMAELTVLYLHNEVVVEPDTVAAPLEEHLTAALEAGDTYEMLTIDENMDVEALVTITLSDPHAASGNPQLPEEMVLSLQWPSPAESMDLAWDLLRGSPLLSGLRAVEAESFMLIDRDRWVALNAFGGAVDDILVRGNAGHGLVLALEAAAVGEDVLFPALNTLTIERVNFEEVKGESGVAFQALLLADLNARRERGASIALSVKECNVTEAVITELRGIMGVDAVDWDGDIIGNARAYMNEDWW